MRASAWNGGFGGLPWLVGCLLLVAGSASAQKYPGQTIPDAPAPAAVPAAPVVPRRPAPPPFAAPQAPFAPSVGVPGAELDPQARELAGQLPLDPATANLQSRLPTDVPGTIRRLGLRVPTGGRIDLRRGRMTTGEVIDALQH